MNILDRFSSHLKDTLARSLRLAAELKNPMVEPIHLLYALFNQKGSLAAELLNRLKVTDKALENSILDLPLNKTPIATGTGKTITAVLTPFSQSARTALEHALLLAQERGHNYVGTEHLLFSIIQLNDSRVMGAFKESGVSSADAAKQVENTLVNTSQFPRVTEMMETIDKIQDNLNDIGDVAPTSPSPSPRAGEGKNAAPTRMKKNTRRDTALDFFAINLTDSAWQKNLDPVIGREIEIERLIQILCRRTKNNPVLLGDPGVGKSAIVEGLAKKIYEGKVPELMRSKKIYALDMGLLIAGTIYRGEFENRLKQVIEEVTENPDIILFIDELHNIVGAGSNQGTMDAANLLKPALARGTIHCIGATTAAEFKKHIENDAALERRFQPIIVKEPSPADTVAILQGLKPNYENYHRVKIEDEAIETAVELSVKYIANKFLPDKAIDLLDETAAAIKLKGKLTHSENKLARLRHKLEAATVAKENAAQDDKFEQAVEFKKQEQALAAEIKKLEQDNKNKKLKPLGTVRSVDIAAQVAKVIGANPSELLSQKNQIKTLSAKLKETIIGQSGAIEQIVSAVARAQLGLSHPGRPLASILFVGESGVGKTETARTLARVLYSNKDALVELNMSEYNESFGVSKLLGSPAGYVGYKDSNQFTDRIKMNPYCVVLFDEIDKAHPDVTKLLLQILENGEINDSTGKKISLKHAIIILTTTVGSEDMNRAGFGFGDKLTTPERAVKEFKEKLKSHFSPEIINRLDEICFFKALNPADLAAIVGLEIKDLNTRITDHNTQILADQTILNQLARQLNPKDGARQIRRQLRAEVEKLLAEIILADNQGKNNIKKTHKLSWQKNQLILK
ncbi:MAG: hypothetical protein A2538_00115 [Candidatus Magasanikbacteria bacterium RIFOXYD2_FULL_41_14]|uniref:Clp R domain-containing protein n=1 Tax=Candidatus Magasanikbacteria bacterium RIFOXYD2_FULL_41_14 TaxID=1798709 RepID=A0A1F6PED8_9BACT|nr:MAG: hypothetical protein A2538_00115 [Candidatus Magasanikbacteria bacterium RIFOXYD2_FULL_41_14]